jgi:hypothetical protein
VYYNDKLKKGVRKLCNMDVRMRNAQNDAEDKPVGMRPLWRPMHEEQGSNNHIHDTN